jgi:hypothetical protein
MSVLAKGGYTRLLTQDYLSGLIDNTGCQVLQYQVSMDGSK